MSGHRAAPRGAAGGVLLAVVGVLVAAVLTAPLLAPAPVAPVDGLDDHNPLIIAHAGASGHAPANTLEAFELALELGADVLEMDLQLTADGEVVVHHDNTVDRQTDGHGLIADHTLAELRELDAGHAFTDDEGRHPYRGEGLTIPTLDEVFAAFPEPFMVLEMKAAGGQDIVEAVADRVRAHDREDGVLLASFDVDFVREARERLPGVATTMPEDEARAFHLRQVLGLHRWWQPPGEVLQVPEFHRGVHIASHRFFAAAAQIGVDTHVWTVNDPDDMRRHLAAGAHGLITDYPGRMVDVLEARAAGEPHPDQAPGDVALTEWLQDRLDWLTPVLRVITVLGDREFAVLGFPVLYWAVSRRVGLRVGVLVLVSAGLNEVGKLLSRTPRPSFLDPDLALVEESTPGIPSGHAQNGVVVWGALAAELRRRWAWVAALLLVLVLSWSRVHLGAHYPRDVVVGWVVGAVLLLAYLWLRRPVEAWLTARRPAGLVWVALAASLVLVALAAAARVAFVGWQPPVEWVGIDAHAWPVGLSHAVTPAGALFGLGCGVALLRVRGGFDVVGPVWQRGLRCLVGLVGVIVLWQGLGAWFPGGEDPVALAYRWLRYAAVGAWIAGLAPLLFVRLGLAPSARDPRAGGGPGRRGLTGSPPSRAPAP